MLSIPTTVYLHNPAHNGDVLFSSQIVNIIVQSNPDIRFKISTSCSSVLFEHLISDRVAFVDYPKKWVFERNETVETMDEIQTYLLNQCDTLWSYKDGNVYINMWQLMIYNHNACYNISTRIDFIRQLFGEIYQATGVKLSFPANHFRELVPQIPQIDISGLLHRIDDITRARNIPPSHKKIMFFNFLGQSGSEPFPPNYNHTMVQNLLYHCCSDAVLIVPDHCEIQHPRLISLLDDCGIQKELSGRSIVIYAHLCRVCEEVYFKNNGGSLFQLNQTNVADRYTKYFYLNGADEYGHAFKYMYGLNIVQPNM